MQHKQTDRLLLLGGESRFQFLAFRLLVPHSPALSPFVLPSSLVVLQILSPNGALTIKAWEPNYLICTIEDCELNCCIPPLSVS